MASPEPQGTHFFLMVIQYRAANGSVATSSTNGTWTPKRRQTRYDVFQDIRAETEARNPECRGGAVVAFDIQPNKL